MFKPFTIKILSIVAMILSAVGLLLSLILANQGQALFVMGIVSWAILLWASYIGFTLSSYKLLENEYKKVGIRIYLIILAFILFFFVGIIIGLVLSVVLLSALWGLKKNIDEWNQRWNSTNTTDPN
ncbi:MAG: hypothetical protein HYZ54_04010 [Ignavibacteriae bacterium]|nr:hypothetical protein [Ignavibacteriota bacterium]